MRQSVTSNVETNGNSVTGTWGWIDNFQDYFAVQENGFGKLQGMHALLGSFVKGRERLRQEITTIIEKSVK
jgi:prophage DNA circulation protein